MNLWVVQTHTPLTPCQEDGPPGQYSTMPGEVSLLPCRPFSLLNRPSSLYFPNSGNPFLMGPHQLFFTDSPLTPCHGYFSILCMPSFLRLFLARTILKEKKNIFCDFLKWNSIKKRFWVVEKSFPELHCILLPLNLICAGFKHAKNVSSCKGCLLEMHFYERWLSMFRHNMTFLPWWLKKQFFEIEIMKMSLGMVCF